jgi:hypothetical protein
MSELDPVHQATIFCSKNGEFTINFLTRKMSKLDLEQTTIFWSLRNPASHGEFTINGNLLTKRELYSVIPKKYRIFRVCDGVCFVKGTITLEIESGIPGFDFELAGRLSVPPSLFATEIRDYKLYSLKDGKFQGITKAQNQRLMDAARKVSDAERAMKEAKEAYELAKQHANYDVQDFDEEPFNDE